MSQDKRTKPILIYDHGGIRTFRDPETGEEFSATVSRPIDGMDQDCRLVAVQCLMPGKEGIGKRLGDLRIAIGSEVALDNRLMLKEAREKGTVTISGLRVWEAEQVVVALKRDGFSAEIVQI